MSKIKTQETLPPVMDHVRIVNEIAPLDRHLLDMSKCDCPPSPYIDMSAEEAYELAKKKLGITRSTKEIQQEFIDIT